MSWRPGEKRWTSLEERWFKRRSATGAAVAAWTLSTLLVLLAFVVAEHLPDLLPRDLQSFAVLASAVAMGILASLATAAWYWKISSLRKGLPTLGAVLCALWAGLGVVGSLGMVAVHERVSRERSAMENSSITFDRATRTLRIDGYIGSSFTEDLDDAIASHPTAQLIEVNSLGGLVDDALRAGRSIARANLPVRVVGECASACVILWASAPSREMTVGAMIGLHQTDSDVDLPISWTQAANDELDLKTVPLMKRAGFNAELLSKRATTPADDMHWVGAVEMLEAGVHLSVVDESGFAITLNHARILRVMQEIDENDAVRSLVEIYAQWAPDVVEAVGPRLYSAWMEDDVEGMFNAGREISSSAKTYALTVAPDEAVVGWARGMQQMLSNALRSSDSGACALLLGGVGDKTDPKPEIGQRIMRLLSDLLITARPGERIRSGQRSKAERDKAEALIIAVYQRKLEVGYPAEYELWSPMQQCAYANDLYSAIFLLATAEAANAIRAAEGIDQ